MSAPGDGRGPEELLSVRGLPRGTGWALAVVMLLLVAWYAVAHVGSGGHPAAKTTVSPGPPPGPSTQVELGPSPGRAEQVSLPLIGITSSLVADPGHMFAIVGGTLVVRAGTRTVTSTPKSVRPDLTYRIQLFLDQGADRLWLLPMQTAYPTVQVVDPDSLHVLGSFAWPRPIAMATAVGGALYVADSVGIFRITESGQSRRLQGPAGSQVRTMTADPRHDRVLLLVASTPGLWLLSQPLDGRAPRWVPAPDALAAGTLVITGSGAIWVGGNGSEGAVLDRLDPATLAVAARAGQLTDRLGGADLLTAGEHSVFVGDTSGDQVLWCVDDVAGRPLESWPFRPALAAVDGADGYVVVDGELRALSLTSCPG